MSEIRQSSPEEIQKAAQELDKLSNEEKKKNRELTPTQMFALADHLEKQGLPEIAAEMRANAQSQSIEPPGKSPLTEMLDKEHADEMRKINERLAIRPPRTPNPLLNTLRAGTKTQAGIDNLINQVDKNTPPSPPNAPKGLTPSGGK